MTDPPRAAGAGSDQSPRPAAPTPGPESGKSTAAGPGRRGGGPSHGGALGRMSPFAIGFFGALGAMVAIVGVGVLSEIQSVLVLVLLSLFLSLGLSPAVEAITRRGGDRGCVGRRYAPRDRRRADGDSDRRCATAALSRGAAPQTRSVVTGADLGVVRPARRRSVAIVTQNSRSSALSMPLRES